MKNTRKEASRQDVPSSKYFADSLNGQQDMSHLWPQGFFDLYGSCKNDNLVEPADTPYDLEPIPALDLE